MECRTCAADTAVPVEINGSARTLCAACAAWFSRHGFEVMIGLRRS